MQKQRTETPSHLKEDFEYYQEHEVKSLNCTNGQDKKNNGIGPRTEKLLNLSTEEFKVIVTRLLTKLKKTI